MLGLEGVISETDFCTGRNIDCGLLRVGVGELGTGANLETAEIGFGLMMGVWRPATEDLRVSDVAFLLGEAEVAFANRDLEGDGLGDERCFSFFVVKGAGAESVDERFSCIAGAGEGFGDCD